MKFSEDRAFDEDSVIPPGVDREFTVFEKNMLPGRCLAFPYGDDSKLLTCEGANAHFIERITSRSATLTKNYDIHTSSVNRGSCQDLLAFIRYLAGSRWIHVTSFATRSILKFVFDAIIKAKEINRSLRISFDPGDDYTERSSPEVVCATQVCDYIFLNKREFRNFAGHPNDTRRPFLASASSIFERTGTDGQVIVLKGRGSCYVFHKVAGKIRGRRYWHRWIPSIFVRDDVGAGDIFAGGYIAGVLVPCFDEFGRGPTKLGTSLVAAKLRRQGGIPLEAFAAIAHSKSDETREREHLNIRDFISTYWPSIAGYAVAVSAGAVGTMLVTLVWP